ncbi:LOW QUALITY PROTEIN: V-type proton ATPase 116 kDa subunit a 1 [Aphomia sociella]
MWSTEGFSGGVRPYKGRVRAISRCSHERLLAVKLFLGQKEDTYHNSCNNIEMGCMLRSDPMTLCDMFIQPEVAFETMSNLGDLSCCQFLDMNPNVQPFLKNYISEMCRCAEMERKLRYIEGEIMKDNIHISQLKDDPKALHPNQMMTFEHIGLTAIGAERSTSGDRVPNLLDKWEIDIMEMAANETNLLKNYVEMSEMFYVLEYIGPLLGDAELRRETLLSKKAITGGGGDIGLGGQLVVMTGVVRRKRCFHLEMMLWRISHGIIYYRQASEDRIFQEPNTVKEIRKVAFLAICQGEELKSRMQKVCSGFRVNIYPCPKTYEERMEMIGKLATRLLDLEQVLKKTAYHRCKALRMMAHQIRTYIVQVKKSKAIYHNLNLFNMDITKKCLIGQCWVPERDMRKVQDSLENSSRTVGTNVSSFMSRETNEVPPTFHRTNKFTNGFQALINAYGDSTYCELNPGLYTIITFPFLFSLMFGDVCHGMILLIFGAWMVKNEKKFIAQRSTNEIWNIFFGGRYVILLMGAFSIYAGFLYNDWFSKCITLMDPYWINNFSEEQIAASPLIELDPKAETGPVYMFGIDPVWIFIPEILFLTCLFFWLIVMIYFKWFTYSAKDEDITKTPGCAPQILILFIDMVLMSTTKPIEEDCEAYMFKSQETVQTVLLVIAVLCVPIMLFGPPVYLHRQNKMNRQVSMKTYSKFRKYQHRDSIMVSDAEGNAKKSNTQFSELMIHQAVHTIEYVLSTISHTASYLRLWALSLAHSQLSHMLWGMIFAKLALADHTLMGSIKVFVVFAIWASFTVCILVVMEGLSAFLHTLRLHWVEFMNKFYSGGGWVFRPFSFKAILSGEEEKIDAVCKKRQKNLQE